MKIQLFILFFLVTYLPVHATDCIAATSQSGLKIQVFDAVVAIDGSGDYTTIQEAIDAAPQGRTITNPWLIFIKNGTYRELIHVPEGKCFIHLIGQNRNKTIIHEKINVQGNPENEKDRPWYANSVAAWEYSKNNPNSIMHEKNDGTVVKISGSDFHAENISFVNDWGVDMKNGPMALAMMTYGDRISFYNCAFRSFQDTWKTAIEDTFRAYAKNCFIEGAVDYIYGSGNCYFETCTLYCVRDGSVLVAPNHKETAQWGYIFESCIVDGVASEKTKFGRPWHHSPIAIFLNTTIKTGFSPEGWSDMGGFPRYFSEYNTQDSNGTPTDTSKRKKCYTGRDKPDETKCIDPVLTSEQAAKFTYAAVTKGKDDWNPRILSDPVGKPINLKLNKNGVLNWDNVSEAIGYVIYSDDKVIGFNRTPCYHLPTIDANVSYYVQSVGKYGSLSERSVAVIKE